MISATDYETNKQKVYPYNTDIECEVESQRSKISKHHEEGKKQTADEVMS